MEIPKKKVLRKNIWQEDLDREVTEHLAKGFELHVMKTLSVRSRREGEQEQNFYRVVFKWRPEEKTESVQHEIETVSAK
ncbi:MAG: hypothetical protein K2X29_02595 [Candidatus Obscuribacterales bacterium]|nr:hypothetical protein [Candidatus Obscuribacterales bacterium]